jgi:hypothetical protein
MLPPRPNGSGPGGHWILDELVDCLLPQLLVVFAEVERQIVSQPHIHFEQPRAIHPPAEAHGDNED